MSYTPTAWQTGDVVTAEKLNKLEGGVAALSNYDFMFTSSLDENGNEVYTADGLSVEELYQKGSENLNALLILNEGSANKAFNYSLYIEDGVTNVLFDFMGRTGRQVLTIQIGSNGTARIFGDTASYTYSNGHYVFTLEESGGGE